MVNLDICLPTFEFNDDVIYTLLRKYSTNINQTNNNVSMSHLYSITLKQKVELRHMMLEIHGLDWARHKHGSVMLYKQKSIAQMHITTHLLGLVRPLQ